MLFRSNCDEEEVCDILTESRSKISPEVRKKVVSQKLQAKAKADEIIINHIPSLVELSYEKVKNRSTKDELKTIEEQVIKINEKKLEILLKREEVKFPKKRVEKVPISRDSVPTKRSTQQQANMPSPASDMIITLPKNLASQLIENFGSVGFEINLDDMNEKDMRVRLNMKTAKSLHRCWSASVREQIGLDKFQTVKELRNGNVIHKEYLVSHNLNLSL